MSNLKITAIEAKAFTIPFAKPIGSSIGTYKGAGWVLVTMRTEGGPMGYGFTMSLGTRGQGAVLATIEDDLAPLALGRDALAPEALWAVLWGANKARMRGGVGLHALSAVDIACWDIVGKTAGLSLNRLLGGYRQTVPLYGSGGWLSLSDKELVAECQGHADLGINAYKLKVGGDRDIERVALLRREMGDDHVLYVDANQRFNVREAVELADQLADYGVAWFEEPVIADSVDDLAAVAAESAIPVAAGENAYMRWGFREICAREAVAYIQPDAVRCGGVTEWMKAAHLADAYNLSLTSHLVHELHAGLLGAVACGHSVEYMELYEGSIFTRDYPVKDGWMEVPDVPGHGVEFDAKALSKLSA